MPSRPLQYDIFASHAHEDEKTGHISAFLKRLKVQHDAEFPDAPLEFYLDTHEIHTGQDWRRRLSEGIQQSRFFLAFLSPGYFAGDWCRREWNAWLDHEISLHILSEGAFPIYFVEIPELTRGLSEQDIAKAIANLRSQSATDIQRHLQQINRRQRLQIRPFFPDGEQALREGKLNTILSDLATDLHTRRKLLDSVDPHKTTVPDYNRKFTGRRQELIQLRDTLENNKTGVVTGLSGLGGMGKTEIAFTYAHAYAVHYPGGRWFIPCEHKSDLRLALLALDGHPLPKSSDEQRQSLDTHFAHVLDQLQKHIQQQGRVLLILDNITDLALLTPAQTRRLSGLRGQLHLLATTRLATPTGSGEQSSAQWLTLDRLAAGDCIELLDKHRPFAGDDNHDTAAELCRVLGCYTLAIHYAALYLAEHPKVSHRDYTVRLRERGIKEVEEQGTQLHPEETYEQDEKRLGVILDFTLRELTALQRHILNYVPFFGPDYIVLDWLRQLNAQPNLERLDPITTDPTHLWEAAIERLAALGLLTRLNGAPLSPPVDDASEIRRTHRLLQDHLLRNLPDQENRQEKMDMLADALDETTRNVQTLRRLRWKLSAMQAIAERRVEMKHPKAAVSLNNIGKRWYELAEYTTAEPLMRLALAMDEVGLGSDHPSIAIRLNNLALLLQATNRLAEAESCLRRALAIDEASLGLFHPNVANRLNSLAVLLHVTSRLAEAESLQRRALVIFQNNYGAEHMEVALCLNNLTGLLNATNRVAEAEPLMRRAMAIFEKSVGATHPMVAAQLTNLAQLLQATNRVAEAEPLMRRALAIDEATYGSEHPNVGRDLNNLAGLLLATNRLTEAEPLMHRGLAILENSYGAEHPAVATQLNNLAGLLHTTNRLAEAEPLYRRALAIDEASYGSGHPNVGRILNNLASLLQTTNRLAEAEQLMRRALAIDESNFGPAHPNIAIRLHNLAKLLHATNRTEEAEPLYRRVVLILLTFTHATGHQHPHLHKVLRDYAQLCFAVQLPENEFWPRMFGIFCEAGMDQSMAKEVLRSVFLQH